VVKRLVGFATDQGSPVFVEIDENDPGYRPIARRDGIAEARKSFESALQEINAAAEQALAVLRDGLLRPDGVEIEFGVRFNAEVGAVIAKATAEGHLKVKLTWSPEKTAGTVAGPGPAS
jgi:NTP-dependent ternary system trypsin peptidase co-occuring protein